MLVAASVVEERASRWHGGHMRESAGGRGFTRRLLAFAGPSLKTGPPAIAYFVSSDVSLAPPICGSGRRDLDDLPRVGRDPDRLAAGLAVGRADIAP